MFAPPITSRQHPFIQRCRRIAGGRGEPGEILLDGLHLLEDAVQAGVRIDGVLTDERHVQTVRSLVPPATTVHVASTDAAAGASPVRAPTGVVSVASWTPQPAGAMLAARDGLYIGVVGVQDPGNVGNIIRSADALGASGVLALDGTADPGGWKALRGAMGSTFRLPVGTGATDDVLTQARAHGIVVAATVVSGGIPLRAHSLALPSLVLVGSEGAGLPQSLVDDADLRLTIPMRSRANSLNAATTAAIAIWELMRPLRETGS